MFRVLLPIFSILVLVACTGPATTGQPTPSAVPVDTPPPAATQETLEASARALVDQLAAGQFDTAVTNFDAKMQQVLPPDKLQETWQALLAQVGPYQGQLGARTERREGYDLVFVTTQFAQALLDTQVTFDDEGQVAGLFFVPAQTSSAEGSESEDSYDPPGYVQMAAFEERNMVIPSGDWILPATFTYPVGEGPFPVVLLIHGSGPQDRDETVGLRKPFRDLAWGLASQGIAVLRYEKRTKEFPERVIANQQEFTVYDETIDDALAAISLLSKMKDVDGERIYALGHSLGGMLLPRIASQAPHLAGLITLAGPSRPLEDLYLEQMTYIVQLDGEVSDQEQETLAQIEQQVARVKDSQLSIDTPPSELPLDIPASYWVDLRGYDPPQAAAQLDQPMLFLQGERDYQVTLDDLQGWQATLASRDDVEFEVYPALDHFFVKGEGLSTPHEDYTSEGHVSNLVVDDIATWIGRH
jgi:dienelactone hydrolase